MTIRHQKNRTSAFTLIELLVVIAIIAVLMGILMPALQAVRKQARGAACLSQIKHWGLIWQMYFDSHDGKMPDVQQGLGTQGGWNRGFWVTVLAPQWEKRPEILMCPSAMRPGDRMQGAYDIIGSYDQAYNHGRFNYRGAGGDLLEDLMCSYGMNLFACSTPVDVQGRKKRYHFQNQIKLSNGGEIPIFLDAMWRGGGPHWDGTEDITPPTENGHWAGYGHEMKHFAMDRHGGGVNALFVDGGARKVQVKKLWDLKWHVDYPMDRARQQSETWWGPWLSKK